MFTSKKLQKEIEELKKENSKLKLTITKLKKNVEQLKKEKQQETRKIYDCLYDLKKLKEGPKPIIKKTNLSNEDLKEINRLIFKKGAGKKVKKPIKKPIKKPKLTKKSKKTKIQDIEDDIQESGTFLFELDNN